MRAKLFYLLILPIFLFGCQQPQQTAPVPASETSGDVLRVTRVIDGDTFALSDGQRVRLIGIDTPEKHQSAKLRQDAARSGRDIATIVALGERASRHAEEMVLNRLVRLDYDPANNATGHRDRYGRTLAYVIVLDENGREYNVNERMVADGFANAYTQFAFAHAERFRQLEREARAAERGLWAENGLDAPLSTAPPAENAPLVGSSGKVYHLSTCRHAAQITRPVYLSSIEEAAAQDFRPCRTCRPDENSAL